MDDAAASCARFLAANGWKGDLTLAQRRQVLWQYNRSDAYIDTILAIQREIAAGGDGRVADAARAD
jgi:membrane-bound lytic murein transglycosylase B